MAAKKLQKIISQGLQDVLTQRLNDTQTAYDGEALKWTGETEFSFTPTQDKTVLAAGNDPAWGVIKGLVMGDFELKLYEMPLEEMNQLFSVKYSVVDGVCVGDDDCETPIIGLSLNNKVKSEASGKTSYNKTILYKAVCDLPAVSLKTIAEGDTAVVNVSVKGKAYPVFFPRADGSQEARTYCIVNSINNAEKYKANEDEIVFPTEFTADNAAATSSGGTTQTPDSET